MTAIDDAAGAAAPSRTMLWTGRALSIVVVLFLAMDATIKLPDIQAVKDAQAQLQWPLKYDRMIGVIDLLCAALYAIPRTSVLGAVLTTGLLGGAVASHLRSGDPLFSHVLFGVYVGVTAWAGLWLREPRLRALMPVKR